MPQPQNRFFGLLTLMADMIAIVAAFGIAYLLRFWSIFPVKGMPAHFQDYFRILVIVLPTYIICLRAYGLYSFRHNLRRVERIFQVIKGVTLAVILLMAVTFFYRQLSYSRIYLIMMWLLSIFFVSINRYFLIQWEYYRRRTNKDITKVLLVGANRNTRNIIHWAQDNPHYGREVVGILANEASVVGKHFEGIPILGTIQQCESFIEQLKPSEVIVLESSFNRERVTDLVAICEDQFIEFKMAADIYGLMTRNVDVEYISTIPLLGFRDLPLDDLGNRFIKRTFDIVVSTSLIILTAPLWIFAVLAILLTDPGPIFYKQERMGRDQKLFNVFKFRTMKVDAEKETGPVWANANDQRKTAAGHFLRRWNIDELPQLLNVLNGDMSLVGPRPERPHFINQFREQIPRYMTRHKIKSGLTGWAQVNGYRGNTSIEERLKYDLYYMENWSLIFDIEILFMTFFAFKNAY